MKELLVPKLMPDNAVLLMCSSHEPRCRGVLARLSGWMPASAIIFHYDDPNPKREMQHKLIVESLAECQSVEELPVTEIDAVRSLGQNVNKLKRILSAIPDQPIVFDISVLTKRHLLMMLQWLDDHGWWDRLWVAYSEPEDYDVSEFIPLSFGLSTLQQIPGFAAVSDLSRPLHLVLFLGYEGDRALAVYEHVQPMQTTLAIPYPPFKPGWVGRTERFNSDLIGVVGQGATRSVDAIDPDLVCSSLRELLGPEDARSETARILSPLGTKPQTLGIYAYLRRCVDSIAVVYASPLRHNHAFFSHGIGMTWLLKRGA